MNSFAPKLICLALAVFLLSCSKRINLQRGGDLLVKNDKHITLNPSAKHSIKLLYTGCGGLVISNGKSAVLTDPYYTGHSALHAPFGKIKIDPKNTQRILDTIKKKIIDPSFIKTVLVTHSHYDHLEDLPYLLEQKKLAGTVTVIGSESTQNSIAYFLKGASRFTNADSSVYLQNPAKPLSGKWIDLPDNMRVMPIESQHAPHFYSIKLMKHCTPKENFGERTKAHTKTKALKWREGRTYSFLLDVFDDEKKDTLRIFIQTSSCNPPYGFPPAAELGKKNVDIAFLCVASYAYVDNYPESILTLLKPKKTILVHWENFFKDMYVENPKSVPGTKLKPFVNRLKKHYHLTENSGLKNFFLMPEPLTLLEIDY